MTENTVSCPKNGFLSPSPSTFTIYHPKSGLGRPLLGPLGSLGHSPPDLKGENLFCVKFHLRSTIRRRMIKNALSRPKNGLLSPSPSTFTFHYPKLGLGRPPLGPLGSLGLPPPTLIGENLFRVNFHLRGTIRRRKTENTLSRPKNGLLSPSLSTFTIYHPKLGLGRPPLGPPGSLGHSPPDQKGENAICVKFQTRHIIYGTNTLSRQGCGTFFPP